MARADRLTTYGLRLTSLALLCAISVHAQAPSTTAPAGTGLIVGQVADADTGRGVPEAVVSIALVPATAGADAKSVQLAASVRRRVIADDDGRYFFVGLPEGRFSLTIAKPGYIAGSYGQRRPGGSIQYVTLADGQRRADVDIRVWRTASVEGVVTDERGEPVVGILIWPMKRVDMAGRASFASQARFGRTDDRGAYRVSGLQPGTYLIGMAGSHTTFPIDVVSASGAAFQNEAFRATGEIQPLGSARHLTVGKHVIGTQYSTMMPLPSQKGQPVRVYPQAFHPSATRIADAQEITLGAGESRDNVNLQVRSVATISISGRVVSPDVPLGVTAVRLIPEGQSRLAAEKDFDAASALTSSNGEFTMLGVPPGRYELRVNSPRALDPSNAAPDAPANAYWASMIVDAGDRDITDLVVTPERLQPISGRVRFDAEVRGSIAETVNLEPASPDAQRATARTKPDGTFVLSGLGGRYVLRADAPPGWRLRSVLHGGRDLADTPFTLSSDAMTDVEVTFTKESASLSGTIRDERSNPSGDAVVLLFPADQRLWQGDGLFARNFFSGRPDRNGVYRLNDLAGGDYLLVAIDDADSTDWRTAARLPKLAAIASRITLQTGIPATRDLKKMEVAGFSPRQDAVEGNFRQSGPFVADDDQQAPARDSTIATTPTGTARISGRVQTSDQTPQPVRGASVVLRSSSGNRWGASALSDDTGQFVFEDVPAGQFTVTASKAAWLDSNLGATRPSRAGTPLTLTAGQQVSGLSITMWRGGVITGRVVDAQGRPAAYVTVEALVPRSSPSTGERMMVAWGTTSTDDRGIYRIFGLRPGPYVVRAIPLPEGGARQGGPGVSVGRLTKADVDRALALARSGTSPATSSSQATQRPLTEGVPTVYSPVFAPQTTDITQAMPVVLTTGQEAAGVDITLDYTPAVRIKGTVRFGDGSPAPNVAVVANPAGDSAALLGLLMTAAAQTRTDSTGAFVLPPTAPGRYTVRATERRQSGTQAGTTETLWAATEVIAEADTETSLTMAPAMTLPMRLVFEGPSPPPTVMPLRQVILMQIGGGGDISNAPRGTVDAEGRALLTGLVPGRYSPVWMSAPPTKETEGWSRLDSMLSGRDVDEYGIEVTPGMTGEWVLRFTREPSSLSGVFSDASGRAATDYFIVVFPADQNRWRTPGLRIRLLRPDQAGAFEAIGLPAGEYYLAALTDVVSGEESDPDFLKELVPSAIRVTIVQGKKTTQNIRIGGS